MTRPNIATPWHRTSFDWLLAEGLPRLLAERVPLVGYHVVPAGAAACHVTVSLGLPDGGALAVQYADVPQPDAEGVFTLDGERAVIMPVAAHENLESAEVLCVGEQLHAYIAERLATAPPTLPWDTTLARAWIALDLWIDEFLREQAWRTPRETPPWLRSNPLNERDELRRVVVTTPRRVSAPEQLGRTCPFETPEGPNVGRILHLAVGATIRNRRVVIVDNQPAAALGLAAALIPCLEHNTPFQLLLGANMLRQWITPPDAEPALVATGAEAAVPGAWCGRTLLTAFISWGADTCGDALVLSASAARRLDYLTPIEPGDKLSNRHGQKGVVSTILPDAEMPHLPDGTPIEVICSFISLHARTSVGMLHEAVLGRVARAEGEPTVAPPFAAPSVDTMRARLERAGLPPTGMERLRRGTNGPPLARPSTVGCVYWGRVHHLARDKMHAATTVGQRAQRQGAREVAVLREVAAWETIAEHFNTRAAGRPDAGTLAARSAMGPLAQAGPPSPAFAALVQRLALVGIHAALSDDAHLAIRFTAVPEEIRAAGAAEVLVLAQAVPHPWLRERPLVAVGREPTVPQWAALVAANSRLGHLLASDAPRSLLERARTSLAARAQEYCDALVTPEQVGFQADVLFSGRAVLAPGADLRLDQVGLADELAWTLFGPLVAGRLGDQGAVEARDAHATATLDAVLATSWLLVQRAPALAPTAFLACRPVRRHDRVVRLHPLATALLGADCDGDQVAVFLPLTREGQHEAGEVLSLAGHLSRDPALLARLVPEAEALWGLASLSLRAEGRAEIAQLVGRAVACPDGHLTRGTLTAVLRAVHAQGESAAVLAVLESLYALGLAEARESGASLSPFAGTSIPRPVTPADPEDRAAWTAAAAEMAERLAACADVLSDDLGPQVLAVRSGAAGDVAHLAWLVGPRGRSGGEGGQDRAVLVRHGSVEGLTADELYGLAPAAREAVAAAGQAWARAGQAERSDDPADLRGYGLLARALRSPRPGVVFALAAAAAETDPLTDVVSRLFVGLPALEGRPA